MEATEAYLPPPLPPPFLSEDALKHLIEHGHVPIRLPDKLEALCESLDQTTQDFFRKDESTKQLAYPAAQSTELGYYVVHGEKEYVTLRSHTARNAGGGSTAEQQLLEDVRSDLERPASELWRQAAAVMYRVLIQISQSLDLPPHVWDPVLDGCMHLPRDQEHTTPSLLRLFRYEPERGVAGRHTDNGLLTLCVGAAKGLQVWRKHADTATGACDEANPSADGAWEDAQGPTLLVGSTLRVLCSSRVAAGIHQVVAGPSGRRSIVFALRPSTKHTLDLAPFGGVGSWDLALLWKAITRNRVNVNAKQELREKQEENRKARLEHHRPAERGIA